MYIQLKENTNAAHQQMFWYCLFTISQDINSKW